MITGQALGTLKPATPAPGMRPRRARAALRRVLRSRLERALATSGGLAAVNRLHRALSLAQKRRFFHLSFDLPCPVDGPWIVDFGGCRLVLPLRRDFDLSWAAATGFHGDAAEVHELYESLVRAPRPPRVVFDVGAGVGLHSLKLLAHGVTVVSFEPNVARHPFFLACCRRNGVRPDLRAMAVGAVSGTVSAVTLDDVVRTDWLHPDVIRIDAEGDEVAVLGGAGMTLERVRPLVVVESRPCGALRLALFAVLASHGYRLHALRFAAPVSAALTRAAFVDCPATSFVARPVSLPDRRSPE